MTEYLIAIGLILLLLLGWIVVQRGYQTFARRHPQLGPFRRVEGGCGACSTGKCGGRVCNGGD